MPKFRDLSDGLFNRWTVLSQAANGKSGRTQWLCRCACGVERVVQGGNLVSGFSKSCGCWNVEAARNKATHGHRRVGMLDGTYSSWAAMIARCENSRSKNWYLYGGRGITVCARWRKSFEHFLEDMGPRPEGMSIERRENNADYTPANCFWLPRNEQSKNRRPFKEWRQKNATQPRS